MAIPARIQVIAQALAAAYDRMREIPDDHLIVQGLTRTPTAFGPVVTPGHLAVISIEAIGDAEWDDELAEDAEVALTMIADACHYMVVAARTPSSERAQTAVALAAARPVQQLHAQVTGDRFRDLNAPGRWWPATLIDEAGLLLSSPVISRAAEQSTWLPHLPPTTPATRHRALAAYDEADQTAWRDTSALGAKALGTWRAVLAGEMAGAGDADLGIVRLALEYPDLRDALILATIPGTGDLPDRLAAGQEPYGPAERAFSAIDDGQVTAEASRIERGLGFLAQVAATAPARGRAPALSVCAYLARIQGNLAAATGWCAAARADNPDYLLAAQIEKDLQRRLVDMAISQGRGHPGLDLPCL